jgi:hypothetical protein
VGSIMMGLGNAADYAVTPILSQLKIMLSLSSVEKCFHFLFSYPYAPRAISTVTNVTNTRPNWPRANARN